MLMHANVMTPSRVEVWTQRLCTASLLALAFGLVVFGLALYA